VNHAGTGTSGNAPLAGIHPVVKSGTRILVSTLGYITPTRRSRGARPGGRSRSNCGLALIRHRCWRPVRGAAQQRIVIATAHR